MSETNVIGKIAEINRKIQYEWEIRDFLSYSAENSKYFSPTFPVLDSTWRIEIWPSFFNSSTYYVSLYLSQVNNKSPKAVHLTFGIRTAKNTVELQKERQCTFSDQALGWPEFEQRRQFLNQKGHYLPFGTLTIICSIIIKSNEQDFMARPDKLIEDLKYMFDRKKDSDVILKVNELTILAHKSILAARSPVFAAMFENEMKEKETGVVVIVDCDLQAFNTFLHYIYSGEVEFAKCDSFLLYKIADKYRVPELMTICVDFMARSLSLENLCETYVFGNQFNEKKLLAYTQNFFNKNFANIVCSEPWQCLLKEDSDLANELLKGMAPKVKIIEE